MRKSLSLLVLNLAIGVAACAPASTDDEMADDRSGEGRGDPSPDDRGTRVAPDAARGAGPDGGAADAARGAGPDGGTADTSDAARPMHVETFLPLAQCVTLPTASVACSGPDVLEPNDKTSIPVETRDGCGLVPGQLSSHNDIDMYSFSSTRTDPVRVRLAYATTPTGAADLRFRVIDPTDTVPLYVADKRADLEWTLDGAFVSKKGIAYDVEIADTGKAACQGYNLLIEPNFCTDAYEDNDSKAQPAKGISYGTMISATIFRDDEDWYDVSALQAAGATCTITAPELTVSSKERLTFRTQTGADITAQYEQLDGTSGKNTSTLTIKAGSGVATLNVSSSEKVCSPYTLVCNPL